MTVQIDTHFTSKTRARIPAAIGAALDVPGKYVTQPSLMLVTVTWRGSTPNMLKDAAKQKSHQHKEYEDGCV